jgi:hypothetical protein
MPRKPETRSINPAFERYYMLYKEQRTLTYLLLPGIIEERTILNMTGLANKHVGYC